MIRALARLAVLVGVFYIAYHYAAPQIRAWRFRDAMTQAARLSGTTDRPEIRKVLLETASDLGIPLSSRRLQVLRGPGGTSIVASWEEIVTLNGWKLGNWVDTLHFGYEVDDSGPDGR